MTEELFRQVCTEAKPAASYYLSLYVDVPYYGGPEEGGWWGSHTNLVCYQHFTTEEARDAALAKLNKLVADMNREELRRYGQQCLNETEWLEERGLDDNFLPEPDGPSEYKVVLEEIPGSHARRGVTHYE